MSGTSDFETVVDAAWAELLACEPELLQPRESISLRAARSSRGVKRCSCFGLGGRPSCTARNAARSTAAVIAETRLDAAFGASLWRGSQACRVGGPRTGVARLVDRARFVSTGVATDIVSTTFLARRTDSRA